MLLVPEQSGPVKSVVVIPFGIVKDQVPRYGPVPSIRVNVSLIAAEDLKVVVVPPKITQQNVIPENMTFTVWPSAAHVQQSTQGSVTRVIRAPAR